MPTHEEEVEGGNHRRAERQVHAAHRKEAAVRHALHRGCRLEAKVWEAQLGPCVEIGNVGPQPVMHSRGQLSLPDVVWITPWDDRAVERVPPSIVVPGGVEGRLDELQEGRLVAGLRIAVVVEGQDEVARRLGRQVVAKRPHAIRPARNYPRPIAKRPVDVRPAVVLHPAGQLEGRLRVVLDDDHPMAGELVLPPFEEVPDAGFADRRDHDRGAGPRPVSVFGPPAHSDLTGTATCAWSNPTNFPPSARRAPRRSASRYGGDSDGRSVNSLAVI